MCCSGDLRRDRTSEEIGVRFDRVLESAGAVVRQSLEIDVTGFPIRAEVQLLEQRQLHLEIVVRGVKIAPNGASIALVHVVRPI